MVYFYLLSQAIPNLQFWLGLPQRAMVSLCLNLLTLKALMTAVVMLQSACQFFGHLVMLNKCSILLLRIGSKLGDILKNTPLKRFYISCSMSNELHGKHWILI